MSENKKTTTNLLLNNQLCFSLYTSSKEIIKKYRPLLAPYSLTYTGYIVILALLEEDSITVKELGEKLYLDSGTLTPLLKKLESSNYITRKRNKKDEREIIITLTTAGRNLEKELVHIPKKINQIFSCSSGEYTELMTILDKIILNIKADD